MAIVIEATKIKESFYLLIPRNIVELIDINDRTKFSLKIKDNGTKKVLEYYFNNLEKND